MRVLSIPTRRMCSRAGKKESATAHTFGAKSQSKATQDPNGCSIAFSTLKTHEMGTSTKVQRLPHFTSTAAVSLFMRRPDTLDEIQREHLAAFRRADPSLNTTYRLAQDFLVMMRQREGERLDAWLSQVHESLLPELQSFAHGVERDKAAVHAGLTLAINNDYVA